MAQRKSKERSTLNAVLKLVDQLSPKEREELSQLLDGKAWGDRWRQLEEVVEKRRIAKGLPTITEEEVYAEFTEHRRTQKGKRAQGSH